MLFGERFHSIDLYLTVNLIYSCHDYVWGPLNWETKDILWMDDYVLIMTYESLALKISKADLNYEAKN